MPMQSTLPDIEAHLDAIIFDFDGVIVESTDIKTEAFRSLFADWSEKLEAIVDLHQRHAGIDRLVKFEVIYREILCLPLTAERKAALAARFAELVVERVVACPLVPGAAAFLAA